ncbi:zinc-ribbon domain-containing protein [Anaeromyxobacter terrae]|uniref:zinc-ribbon domain-containing protein n=1 Tax=Anaeromyxobacter terrae TaxID=2925406 RepID=UPI001F5A0013|nr:zinc-ribbon domain-containing protein [Anaeromyxobacter sp. SG22]
MKFVCDSCGKRFASVDEPAPGRVYRVRCRCGHVILVRGPAAAPATRAAEARLRSVEPPPAPPPLRAPSQEPERAAAPVAPPPRAETVPGRGGPAPEATEAEAEAELAPVEAALPAPPRRPDETEPVLPDDPFLRAVSEAAPAAGGAEAIPSGEAVAAVAPEQEGGTPPHADAPRPERRRLSLGLEDEAASGAGRRVLLAAVAVLALLAAIAAWMTLRT